MFLFSGSFTFAVSMKDPPLVFVSVFLRVYPVCGICDLFLFFCAYTRFVGGVLAGSLCHFVFVCSAARSSVRLLTLILVDTVEMKAYFMLVLPRRWFVHL